MRIPAIAECTYPDREPAQLGASCATASAAGAGTCAFPDVLASQQESGSAVSASVSMGDRVHTVRKGDTLWDLCEATLATRGAQPTDGDVYHAVRQVAQANRLNDPDLILVGQRIDLSTLLPSRGAEALSPGPTRRPQTDEIATGAVKAAEASFAATTPPASVRRLSFSEELGSSSANTGGPAVATVDMTALMESILAPEEEAVSAVTGGSPWAGILESPARLTSEFGMRKDPFTGRLAHHDGIDLAADTGTSVRAFKGGRVAFSGWMPGYGKAVIIRHTEGVETVYGHNSKNLVRSGEWVDAGTDIAEVGSTGRSTGPHLHFEVRRRGHAVDPIPFIEGETSRGADRVR